jgi:alpha-tubulin suppressor-like RCC1 family protein
VPGVDDAVQIAAGWGLTCVRRRNGAIRCWGSVRKGRRRAPAEVAGIAGAIDLAVGRDRVCAVLRDGGVACKLLDDDAPAGRVAGLEGAKQVAAGARHTCALLADRTVRCWGSNDVGQLGDGTQRSVSGPARVLELDGVVRIGATQSGSCAFRADGEVACWGDLGLGEPTTEPWTLPSVDGMVGAAGAIDRACGLFVDGSVECVWREAGLPERRKVAGISDAVQLVAGFDHFCALGRDGRVRCWGNGGDGQLGDSAAGSDVPRPVPGLDDARDLAAGMFACAARAGGGVTCWGHHPFRGGKGTAPQAVPGVSDAVRLATDSDKAMCALGKSGAVRCWGNLAWMGATPDGNAVTALGALGAGGGARGLALGNGFACAVEADGKVRCAGKDDHGERAGGTRSEANVVAGLDPAAEIATVDGLVCARLASGKVACWGAVALQPGLGDEMEMVREGEEAGFAYGNPFVRLVRRKVRAVAQRSPRLLPEIEGATWLGGVGKELCAVRRGEALCWSRESALAAKPVAGLASAVELAGGCALLADGRVACREIAAGASGAEAAEFKPVAGLSEVAQVAAGWGFTCARKKDGSVWCWGSNLFGALGDGGSWAWHEKPVVVDLR